MLVVHTCTKYQVGGNLAICFKLPIKCFDKFVELSSTLTQVVLICFSRENFFYRPGGMVLNLFGTSEQWISKNGGRLLQFVEVHSNFV